MAKTNQESVGNIQATNRRSFLLWGVTAALATCGALAGIGGQALRFLLGPSPSSKERALRLHEESQALLAKERFASLKTERMVSERLEIARLSELDESEGKMVTDYFMQPCLVFRTSEESCIARSAVCTHLGCTVQSRLVDNKIYCACHGSYFDLFTGQPVSGPATFALEEEPIKIEGDKVFLLRPREPIKIGPSQMPLDPV